MGFLQTIAAKNFGLAFVLLFEVARTQE